MHVLMLELFLLLLAINLACKTIYAFCNCFTLSIFAVNLLPKCDGHCRQAIPRFLLYILLGANAWIFGPFKRILPLACMSIAFQVVVLQMNGNDYSSNSIHVFHIGKLRLKLSKGKTAKAKEFYSSAMQVINCPSNFSYVYEFVNLWAMSRTFSLFPAFHFLFSLLSNIPWVSYSIG